MVQRGIPLAVGKAQGAPSIGTCLGLAGAQGGICPTPQRTPGEDTELRQLSLKQISRPQV